MTSVLENKRSHDLIIIMAGGLGKRMNSQLPKVLHRVSGKPMIVHVIESGLHIKPFNICIVVGKYRDIIADTIAQYIDIQIIENHITYIDQPEPLGTGHAIMCCGDYIDKNKLNIANILILSGDVPFIKTETISNLLSTGFNARMLVAELDNPHGYGRVVLSPKNSHLIEKIVEEKDCNQEEKNIKLINGGIYSFRREILTRYIKLITNNNAQREYYLTDIIGFFTRDNINIDYIKLCDDDLIQITGINTPEQLEELDRFVSCK